MSHKTEGVISILAGFLVLFTATVNQWLALGIAAVAIVFIVTLNIKRYLARKRAAALPVVVNESKQMPTLANAEQSEQREENLEKVEALAREKGSLTNADVEVLLSVSDATAERYLHELETKGILEQVGSTGSGVSYKIK